MLATGIGLGDEREVSRLRKTAAQFRHVLIVWERLFNGFIL